MKPHLLDLLVCPVSQSRLELDVFASEGDDIMEGVLRAPLGQIYPIHRGIPRFVSSDAYTSSFGYEWNRHARIYFDGTDRQRVHSTAAQLARKLDISPERVRDGLVLDVGCGTGANAAALTEFGAREVIGVDLSAAVEAAFQNTRHLPNVHIVQADLFQLPFRRGSFDLVYSMGVLHHTPDTKQAVLALTALLKPKGILAIWVYGVSGGISHCWSEWLRRLTTTLPPSLLYAGCWLAVPAYYVYKIPILGKLLCFFLPPFSTEPYWEDRVLDTFDWYAPRYQWKHTYPEVYHWFQEAHLTDIHLLDVPVSLWGRKHGEDL